MDQILVEMKIEIIISWKWSGIIYFPSPSLFLFSNIQLYFVLFVSGNIISIYILRNNHIRLDLHPSFTNLCICLVGFFWFMQSYDLSWSLVFQAVFDSLFLITSNSVFAVQAAIWPQQVIYTLYTLYEVNLLGWTLGHLSRYHLAERKLI